MKAIELTSEHKDQVFELLRNRERFTKLNNTGQTLDQLLTRTEKSLNDHKLERVVGAFDSTGLGAIMVQTYAAKIPVWIMQYYATRENTISLKTGYGECLEACWEKAITDAEEKGMYDFWYSVPEQYAKVGPRLQLLSPSLLRYEVYTDTIIPAGEYPKYDIHNHAYGALIKPHAVWIRHGVCKQEFRKVPLTT